MGAYLSEPVTEPVSEMGGNDRLKFGATSMQGWRVNQEDAHNCLVDFDQSKKCSFFAVYDGHGGGEVAKYSAMHFPNFLRQLTQWIDGNIEKAFINAFLEFDEKLRSPSVMQELKTMAGNKHDDEAEEDEDRNALLKEAAMPLEKILLKYGLSVFLDGDDHGEVHKHNSTRKKFLSPNFRRKKDGKRGNSNGNEENVPCKLDLNEAISEQSDQLVGETEELRKTMSKREMKDKAALPSPTIQPMSKKFKQDEGCLEQWIVEDNAPSPTVPEDKVKNGDDDCSSGDQSEDVPPFRRLCFSESQMSSRIRAEATLARDRVSMATLSTPNNSDDPPPSSTAPAADRPLVSPRLRMSKSESEAQDLAKDKQQKEEAAVEANKAGITKTSIGVVRTSESVSGVIHAVVLFRSTHGSRLQCPQKCLRTSLFGTQDHSCTPPNSPTDWLPISVVLRGRTPTRIECHYYSVPLYHHICAYLLLWIFSTCVAN